jgi:type I restriction enzyme S subunit
MSDIPTNWIEVLFGELNQFSSNTIDPASFSDEEFELYSVPSFPSREPALVTGKEIGSTKQALQPDDVLVCKINPRINRVWHVAPYKIRRQIGSSEWIGFRVPYLDSRYFQYYFSSNEFRESLCADVTGVGGSLTCAQPKKVATFFVPVAPVSEQKRIADKLDAVLARVDACRDRIARIPAILKRFCSYLRQAH